MQEPQQAVGRDGAAFVKDPAGLMVGRFGLSVPGSSKQVILSLFLLQSQPLMSRFVPVFTGKTRLMRCRSTRQIGDCRGSLVAGRNALIR